MSHDLAAPKAESSVGRIAFLVRRAETTEVANNIFAARETGAVVGALETLFRHGELHGRGARVDGIH